MITTKKIIFHLLPYWWPPLPIITLPCPAPSPLITITLFCISMCLSLFHLICSFILFLFVYYQESFIFHMSEIIQYWSVFISLRIIPSRSNPVVTNGKILFLWLTSIPLCVCVHVCVQHTCRIFIHSFIDGHSGCFHIFLCWINTQKWDSWPYGRWTIFSNTIIASWGAESR